MTLKPTSDPLTADARHEPTSLPCTCLRLRRIARQVTNLYDGALAQNGVSIVTYAVLSALSREEPLTLSALAERVGTDRTTLSRTVERMRLVELVAAAPGDDRRERRLSLTAHGRDTAAAARRSWRETEAELVTRYGAERLAKLHALLAELEQAAGHTADADVAQVG
ncbi:MarR family winged helix-turn-helix transcriptional regulator [Acuticoccus sp.]|uniref:MarR family winged helix-turn-helix transcriptional regulator n=1 Tax=Acuticoccus sp. TaxID=1904378 RepID=UPI003B521D4D